MRFVVCGEALIDLIEGDDASDSSNRPWRAVAGGGPLNTSVALARLGASVAFLGRFGNDSFATQLRTHLESSGCSLAMSVEADQPTSLAVVSLDHEGKAQYTFHFENTANFSWTANEIPELGSDDWLHFGSIGAVVAPGAAELVAGIARSKARKSYDINVRPAVLPDLEAYRARVYENMRVVAASGGVVKASDEDIELLTGRSDVVDVASAWVRQFAIPVFVITLGADGAMAVTSDGRTFTAPGRRVDVVDTVGAGDTFMAGFLHAYVANGDIERALQRGVAAAALVCQRQGANPPVLGDVDALFGGDCVTA